ncbi:MAG: 4-hydroxy-tetrahydrodipicolinate synthase [Bacteroidales bacterium]|nr:4-hydroxy-tetrahydrodipicolinate synthase [Bacteroidales bacterium]
MTMNFKGTGVAIVTPFRKYGTVDFTALGNLVEHIISNGVDYIVALGTTSEAATLTEDEKQAVVDFVIETNNGRVPLVVGMGGNNTQAVINQIKKTSFEGIDGILSVAPYYNKPQPKGIYQHFNTISSASPVPVIIYNVPSRTSVNIPTEITLKLAAENENIVAIKEASGDMTQIMEIIKHKPKDFVVLSGDDNLTLAMMAMGAEGVISVVANALPKEFSTMVNLALEGKIVEAREIHYKVMEIIEALFADGNPAGIKAALEILGLMQNYLRLPLVKANKTVYHTLQKLLQELK